MHLTKSKAAISSSQPALLAPNFAKPFKLAVNASDVGEGAVFLQEDDEDIETCRVFFQET